MSKPNAMECSNSSCSNTGNGRMVSCWLCLNFYHLSCSGLKARDADALEDPQKFLQWTCPSCRKINIEFYKFFRDSKSEFEKINKDLLVLQNKFSKFGELFNNYQNLDKFVNTQDCVSPKRKREGLRSAASQSTSTSPMSALKTINNECENGALFTSKESIPLSARNNLRSSSINLIPSTSPSPVTPIISPSKNVPDQLQQTISFSHALTTNLNNNSQSSPKPLKVIPPGRSIFISRLASDTTVKDIEYYIKTKLRKNCNLSIFKYSYAQPRTISSFKITVPNEFFENILDSNFWPVSTFVREFVLTDRRRNNDRLPGSRPETSKN